MLFDERWNKKVTFDPLSLDALIAWLETRDPSEFYNGGNGEVCLLGQYGNTFGMAGEFCGWRDSAGELQKFPNGFCQVALQSPTTFGAALARARALRAAREAVDHPYSAAETSPINSLTPSSDNGRGKEDERG